MEDYKPKKRKYKTKKQPDGSQQWSRPGFGKPGDLSGEAHDRAAVKSKNPAKFGRTVARAWYGAMSNTVDTAHRKGKAKRRGRK
jgi:hypothetical protein